MAENNEKSLTRAYIYLFLGGIFGAHHFYLGRDEHAFLIITTVGGYFTLGLIRDLWRLPEYVKDANEEPEYMRGLKEQIIKHRRPPSSVVRQVALLVVGNFFALLVQYSIPQDIISDQTETILRFILIPPASAIGVWLVGNVGRHQGCLWKPLVASYLSLAASTSLGMPPESLTTLFALLTFNRLCNSWRLKRRRTKPWKRMAFITIGLIIYFSFWTSWFYFKCEFMHPDTSETVKCKDSLPSLHEIKDFIWMMIDEIQNQSSKRSEAFKTLGLEDGASPSEIRARYKILSREFHPDKEIDVDKKKAVQEKFIQVQNAYNRLVGTGERFPKQGEL